MSEVRFSAEKAVVRSARNQSFGYEVYLGREMRAPTLFIEGNQSGKIAA